jgi:nuclear pore complex protein Nup214
VVSQGFGIGQTTPVKSGFGTPAAFGGTPAFGSPPAFGALATPSSPVFGGAPALGAGAVPPAFGASAISAPTTVFGSSLASDVPTFGSMGGGGSTFGNLSQQGNF